MISVPKLALFPLLFSFLILSLSGQITPVTTYHNDISRTGWYQTEAILNPSNVNPTTFGKFGVLPVDGQVYAQTLYVPSVTIPNKGVHNVLYVATEHDSVYAFDADLKVGGTPTVLWQFTFLNNAQTTTVPAEDTGTEDITPEVGITSTPVIDLSTNTLYVVGKVKIAGVGGASPTYSHLLAALDITTGANKFGGPVSLAAAFPGNCLFNSDGSTVQFNALSHLNRPGLALNNGSVYVSFASHGDTSYFNGWILAYNATNLAQQVAVWNAAPNTIGGSQECRAGIWMSGGAPAVDSAGNIYVATSNGEFNASSAGNDYGDSIVKLTSALIPTDYFTPYDQMQLAGADIDLGSGGVLLLPDQPGSFPHLLVQSGKEGTIYLVNRDALGGYSTNANNPEIVQNIPGAAGLYATMAYFNGTIYYGGASDYLRAYTLNNGLLSASPTQTSLEKFGWPGSTPSITSNGVNNAIVWLIDARNWSNGGPAIVYAYSAANIANPLWTSAQTGARDQAGLAIKFSVPTIANGRLYAGTANEVDVYGTFNGAAPLAITTTSIPSATVGVSYSFAVSASGGQTPYAFSFSNLPPGLTGNSGGVVSGAATSSAGSPFSVSVGVTDALGATGSVNLSFPVCSFQVTPASIADDSSGGSVSLSIAANTSSCSWNINTTPSWITFSAGSGIGSGSVNAIVAANSAGVQRLGSAVLGGQPIAVTQWGTAQTFSDVLPTDYFFDAANLLKTKNISAGCSVSPLMFCPALNLTRAQMAIFVVRAIMGTDAFPFSPDPVFGDVPGNAFGFQWIQKLSELGVTAGCGAGNFCPDINVTRDQLAVFLIRARYGASTQVDFPSTPFFQDVPADAFAFNWIQRLKEDSITGGCTPDLYCPANPVTRGDTAILLMRAGFNQLLPSAQPILTQATPAAFARNQTQTVTIHGLNTHFAQGSTLIKPILGFMIGAVTVVNATTLTVSLTAGATASAQPESIWLITGSEQSVLPNTLTIAP